MLFITKQEPVMSCKATWFLIKLNFRWDMLLLVGRLFRSLTN